jgi:hypothetical protein
MYATCLTHLILLNFIVLSTFGEAPPCEFSSASCHFIFPRSKYYLQLPVLKLP